MIMTETQNEQLPNLTSVTDGDPLPDLTSIDGLHIERAPHAVACGSLGCTESEQLIRAVIEDVGRRVLCASHTADLVRREVLSG
jgi:tRNA U55 pseudouridine synthase TruB